MKNKSEKVRFNANPKPRRYFSETREFNVIRKLGEHFEVISLQKIVENRIQRESVCYFMQEGLLEFDATAQGYKITGAGYAFKKATFVRLKNKVVEFLVNTFTGALIAALVSHFIS